MYLKSADYEVRVIGPVNEATPEVLTPDALRFLGFLAHTFEPRRQALLQARIVRAAAWDGGETPGFVKDHPARTDPSWRCAPIPDDVADRRVEITGPVDRKMVINGLNSGACVYMADMEDSTSPTWENVTVGQLNLRDAVRRNISFTNPSNGKQYKLNDKTAVLFVRPRGWHLNEGHVLVNGQVMSGSLFDFALYFYHNHAALAASGTRPYYYLPKLEDHLEARLWNDVFRVAQDYLGVEQGTIRATVLLETIPATFQMEEILYELRDHSIGLNCGRWDYLFSFIKTLKYHPDKITPDRRHLTMTTPLMQAYVKRLVQICHQRGTFAMGGMSAAIPVKNDQEANRKSMANVEADKVREVKAGHDGTWVAHPALVTVAKKVFDQHMHTPNQVPAFSGYVQPINIDERSKQSLLELPVISESVTSKDLNHGIGIVLAYSEAWLRGVGCIPLHNAMEDAATAEISRAQIWQWREHGVETVDAGGMRQIVTAERIGQLINEHVSKKEGGKWGLAGKLVYDMLTAPKLDQFLTSVCYPYICTTHLGNTDVSRL